MPPCKSKERPTRNSRQTPEVEESGNTQPQPTDNQGQNLEEGQNQNQNPPQVNNDPAAILLAFLQQQTQNPPEHRRPRAEQTQSTIEKTFEIVGVEEDKKTIFAAFMLKGEANYWWEAKRTIEDNPVIPWERFTTLFLEKYFPRHLEQQMELKFLELKQGSMTVAEYENKFSELSRFVPYHVDTEEKRTRCFQLGLQPWIQNRVAVLEISNYATLVHKASIVESGNDLYPKDKGGVKRKFSINTGNSGMKFDGSKNKKPFMNREDRKMDRSRFGHQDSRGNETKSRTPQTDKAIICHNCGRKGHYARECRQPRKESEVPTLMAPPTQDNRNSSNANVKPTVRTFNMTLKDAITDNDVIIEIKGKPFVVDLIPFKLGEFDVILGMDWLMPYDAQINCRLKKVSLQSLDKKKVILYGQKQTRKFLTMLQARRILRQGCQAYLAFVIDTMKPTPMLEEIPVVKKLEDVFPEDLPCLPPDREIEFTIDLAPGMTPVSKAPYRMAPIEMKKLAMQLQELLNKGVIRPSISP
ncbi:uncharacterized protein LOC141672325 [Apium graveolens]|uniref:uncharacterized protein LOC141672325 n=1 Tax=Apium graveolens TaxID=4045 RepID=UPI003D7A048D